MIYDEDIMFILDQTQILIQTIVKSKIFKDYLDANKNLDNPLTKEKQKLFIDAKEEFALVEKYAKYAPDYKEKINTLRETKKNLDLDDKIANFHKCERDLQLVLDEIVTRLAKVVSSNIKIDAGNPFSKHHCGGCHG